jgi:general secretion pathway protein E
MRLSPPTWPRFAQALVLMLAATSVAAAAFPRGPGFYYDSFHLIIVLASYIGWVAICGWVNSDSITQKLDSNSWNALMLGAGVLGLFVLWSLTSFWAAWFLFWILVLVSLYAYIHTRDRRAHELDKIMTQANLAYMLNKYLNIKMKVEKGGTKRSGPGVPVKILKRGGGSMREGDGDTRVKSSKGYRAALEMIFEAATRRATDIHMEPASDEMTVRYRIDGIMTNVAPFTRATGDGVINIFKVVCNLDITEKRKAQDGSFSAQVENRNIEFRVATAGSIHGEKMVMRLLDYSQALVDLERIGMSAATQEAIKELVLRPHGMFLVCGPTGSGKSTTLYACLHEIDRFQQNVITIENPVEYKLDNVTQIEINPKAGKTFASELRSILRQDPDVIMVGEIRDKETAEIACQAAQTGHLVFSTLHANDTITALGRLIDLGVAPFQVASALNAVLGQRLVRRLCKKCRQRYRPTPDILKKLHAEASDVKYLYKPTEASGEDENEAVCEDCGGMGYLKRTGIFELLVITDTIREMLRENPNIQAIKAEAIKSGLTSLHAYGTQLVLAGETSMQELMRVSK